VRIKQLMLENFRPFCGRHTIDLSVEKSRPVILIKALNDVGKTSLFKAIQFCLYGSKATGEKAFRHVNRTACTQNDGRTSVKLIFDHEEKLYEITRFVEFKKSPPGSFPDVSDEVLEVRVDGIPEKLESIKEQNIYIEAILPEDASQFFLFDGEDIQKYTRHPPGERVKEAIEMVLGIRELLNAREDIEDISRDLGRELDDLLVERSKHAQEAVAVENLGNDITQIRNKIAELGDRIKQAEENVRSCDETLKKHTAIQAKIESRKQAEHNRDLLREQIKANENKIRDFNRHLGVILVAPLLLELSRLGRKTVPHWKRAAISAVLQSDFCICDRPIDQSTRERFERILDRNLGVSSLQYLGDQATELLFDTQPEALEKNLYEILAQRRDLESNLVLQEQTISDLDKEIGGREDLADDIKAAADTRRRAAVDLQQYIVEKQAKEMDLETKNSEYGRRQAKLAEQFTDKDIESKKAHLRSSEACETAVKEAIDELVDKSKQRVAELASKVFLELTNAPRLYQGIEITNEYELKIKTIGGTTRPVWDQSPSAGQSQIIATAYIAALNRYTAREAPVIIDTPIGRLDPIHKRNLIEYYPEIGPQVIILYQPSELSSEDIEPIEKCIASEWLLERDPSNPDASIFRRVKGR